MKGTRKSAFYLDLFYGYKPGTVYGFGRELHGEVLFVGRYIIIF
jgi:hypothetical protein